MDVSSPAGNQLYDGDIDIEYDYGGDAPTNDDEHMSEDGQFPRPGTAVTDDLMADADHANVTSIPTIVEEEMQDSDDAEQPQEQQVDDEELIDYEDEIYPDPPQEVPVVEAFQIQEQSQMKEFPIAQTADSGLPMPPEVVADNDHVTEEIVREHKDIAVEVGQEPEAVPEPDLVAEPEVVGEPELAAEPEVVTEPEVVAEPQVLATCDEATTVAEEAAGHVEAEGQDTVELAPQEAPQSEQSVAESVPEVAAVDASGIVEAVDVVNENDQYDTTQAETEQNATISTPKAPSRHPGTINVSGGSVADSPQTPTDRTLHAMLIQYGEYQWPLFKSQSQPDGLLKDDNLLNVSLTDLLNNIRMRLASKVDEADMITKARELVLNFDLFGSMVAEVCHLAIPSNRQPLTIAQSSLHASATSLNDVLGVYLALHENDGVSEHDTPPLSMTLTSQPNFSHNLASLKQMAATGLGLPKAAIEIPNITAAENESTVARTHESETSAYHGTAVSVHDEDQDPEAQEDAEHEDQDDQYFQEDADDDKTDGEPVEYQEDQYQDEGVDEYYQEDAADESVARSEAREAATAEGDQSEAPIMNAEEAVQPTPDASSAVARTSPTNDTTGECRSEDYIDWEDDDLTDDTTELREDEGEDEFSALLNEFSTEKKEATPTADANVDEHADDAKHDESKIEPAASVGLEEDYSQHDVGGNESHYDVDEADGQSTHNDNVAEPPAEVDHSQDGSPDPVGADQTQEVEEEDPFTFDLLDDDGNEPFDDTDDVAETAHQNDVVNDEDDIGFDLDEDELKPVSPTTSTPGHGKRPYEESADEDHIDFSEPEQKKARAD